VALSNDFQFIKIPWLIFYNEDLLEIWEPIHFIKDYTHKGLQWYYQENNHFVYSFASFQNIGESLEFFLHLDKK
jgi:hypothetical protein